MADWIYFLHPPREDFAATMTDAEREAWGRHFERLQGLLADGVLILAGPTLGTVNTGVTVFEAPDEDAARAIMNEDPAIAGGFATGSCGRSGCPCCAAADPAQGSSLSAASMRSSRSPRNCSSAARFCSTSTRRVSWMARDSWITSRRCASVVAAAW